MSIPAHILVVGASASGLATVEALRRHGYTGRITVLGDELHQPYDRPPLSKQILVGDWMPERAVLREPAHLLSLEAEFILGDRAVSLDQATRTVETASGRSIQADAIVIATGASPRRLPGQDEFTGVHVLRTLDDALALRDELLPEPRVVVVGEGVLGSEIAASARKLGADVTIVGPLAGPLAAQVGPMVSNLLGDLHTRNGVRLRLGNGVDSLVGEDGRVTGVRLTTGDVVPADVVVVAIGAIPATGWLASSGLALDNGVVCDSSCRAAEGIYAVGDVARWRHEQLESVVRLENRTNATEQAAAVAASILGDSKPYIPVPYFWSDQFDVKVQVFGSVSPNAEVNVVEGSVEDGRFVTRYATDGVVTAVVGWNMPKQVRAHRQSIVDSLDARLVAASPTMQKEMTR